MDDINFKTLTFDDLISMRKFLENCPFRMSDYTATFKFMWQKYDALKFAYVENCLVFVFRRGGRSYFYYPLAENQKILPQPIQKL